MKILRIILISLYFTCAYAFSASAQLTIGTVDPGPYTPGSTIAATFSINPATCIPQGNIFRMYLSDASGNFNAPLTQIGQYNGFYGTFVNGVIPTGTPGGALYKIRILSTATGLSTDSGPFVINPALPALEARIVSSRTLANSNAEAFGFCASQTGAAADIVLSNPLSASGVATATLTNELDQSTSVMVINPQVTYRPDQAHYTMFVKVVALNGTVATKAYFIINNKTLTSLNTSGSNVVCLPGGALSYPIDVNSIRENFPGDTYRVDWGDGNTNVYTFCDLKVGTISHSYLTTSCGRTNVSGNSTVYNAFGINMQLVNPFCGNVGTPISTTAKVVHVTENNFDGPDFGCTNVNVRFRNTSVLGDDPENTGPSCLQDQATFNWYVDGMLILAGVPITTPFDYAFPTHGTHTVRLESISSTPCQGLVFEQDICIQDRPQPIFTLPPARPCIGSTVKPVNNSVIDATCSTNNAYIWTVTPMAGVTFANGTNASSAEPEFQFSTPGTYQVVLLITTATCGTIASAPQQIIVDAPPTATLSGDAILCNVATYDFDPNTPGPTRTVLSGTSVDAANTYTWTVTGGAFNFVGGNSHTKYPKIQFLDFATYTVTVVHQNSCGTVSDSQVISFNPAPVVAAGGDFNICYYDPSVTLNGSVTGGSIVTNSWVGGNGTFTPNRNALNATYAPTLAEKIAGQVTLTLRTTTSLPAPCDVIEDYVVINIKPEVTVTSSNNKSICTGTAVNYTPTSATAGATFAWTAVGSANATGFATSGNGTINDVVTNTDATINASVVYTITPSGNGCVGTPFTFTVTITPKPILTPTAANAAICSQQNAGITLTSNLGPTTKYTWTSAATGGVTGNSSNNTPTATTTINDQLVNNGTISESVTYTITPISANGCPGTPETITITVEPKPTTPFAGASKSICNQTSFVLEGNQPIVGTGKWTQVSGPTTVLFADDTQYNSTVSNLQLGGTYVFRWAITGAPSCTTNPSEVTITVNPLSEGGSTAGSRAVCASGNTGQITLSGHVGNVVRWESSTDGIIWSTISNTTATFTYINLTATTRYRAVVQSGVCASANSTESIITVDPAPTIANAGLNQRICATSTTLNGNTPVVGTGMWSVVPANPAITFNDAALPNATVSNMVQGQTYTFRWTITNTASCTPSTSDVMVAIDLPSNGGTTTGSNTVCSGTGSGQITVSAHVGNIVRWESSTDGFNTITTIATTATSIPYANLTTTTQYRAVVKNGTCGEVYSTLSTITVSAGTTAAVVTPIPTLCDQDGTTLTGNPPTGSAGLWTVESGPPGIQITDPTLYNTTVTNLARGATYVLKWTIKGLPACGDSDALLTITNLAPIANNSISTPILRNCNGQTIILAGSIPTGGNGTYAYVWESSPTGAAPWTTMTETTRDLSVTVTSTLSYRRTVNSGTCSTVSNVLNIEALPAIANNTLANVPAICLGSTPSPIVGSQPTGGDGTYAYSWESNNGNGWNGIVGATGKDYAPSAITQTTSYRRTASSGPCAGAFGNVSNIVTITVNPNAIAEFTATNNVSCAPFQLNTVITTVTYPQNGTYEWFANGVSIGTGVNFPPYEITGYNQSVDIILRVTSNNGCAPSESAPQTFSTRENIVAGFTQNVTEDCGPIDVTFANTTIDAPTNIYEWSIDGATVSNARELGTRTLAPNNNGKDRTYNITLKVTTDCGTTSVSHTVTIYARPIPILSPVKNTGCSTFTAEFINNSPGEETYTYTVDFGDGTSQDYLWGEPIRHDYTVTLTTSFSVTLTAKNACGAVTSSPFSIVVTPNNITPAFYAPPEQQTICTGDEVTFTNNTSGAKDFLYDFKDGTPPVPSINGQQGEIIRHRFMQPGRYDVLMTATNDCASPKSLTQTIFVIARPTVAISADVTSGCEGLVVKFTQTSTGAVRYDWDFGDGGTSNDPNPTHAFNAPPGQYRVTLRVTNANNCTQDAILPDGINIVGPPITEFAISPSNTISIPDYTFKFTNESLNNPVRYEWDFGDKTGISPQKDPQHTYLDTGTYVVTLRAYNQYGCMGTVTHDVHIVGVPGYTFVPNSFIPGSTSIPLQTFRAVGSGMKSWRMIILNKWGQVLWETTKLEDGKPVEGWDGTYKGVPQPQGIYFWRIEVELINGSEWKGMTFGNAPPRRTGQIYLIR